VTFSAEWNRKYAAGGYEVEGTSSHLIHLMLNYSAGMVGNIVLELGCGDGGNIPFFSTVKAAYFGIDGSHAAVSKALARYPQYVNRIVCGDFTREQPFPYKFSLIVDRAAVPHNDTASIRSCVDLIWDSLLPGGLFMSSDWFSSNHSEATNGEPVDQCTRTGYPEGQFDGIGRVHYSSYEELSELFARFEPVVIQERMTRRPVGGFMKEVTDPRWISKRFKGLEYTSAVWDFVVRKPK
jgi:SAM-dependent methyltransferase